MNQDLSFNVNADQWIFRSDSQNPGFSESADQQISQDPGFKENTELQISQSRSGF